MSRQRDRCGAASLRGAAASVAATAALLLTFVLGHPTAALGQQVQLQPPSDPFTSPPPPLRRAAVIIDDIGDKLYAGRRAIALPAEVTIAVLPHTAYGQRLAEEAHRAGREVMLHLPMQAKNGADPGLGALLLDMDEGAVRQTVRDALAAVPHARGVNNHMGSLITRHPGHMAWVMEELERNGALYFIDSRTSARTVAQRLAAEHGIPNAARKVFLDPVGGEVQIEQQYQLFVQTAARQDGVIAIGHPYAETLELLEQRLPQLAAHGIVIVPVSNLIEQPAE